nr:hypothetical protein BCU55_01990 [Shewanella sp. 10N.286.48.A6]
MSFLRIDNFVTFEKTHTYQYPANFLKCCIDRVNKDAFFFRQYFEQYLHILENIQFTTRT